MVGETDRHYVYIPLWMKQAAFKVSNQSKCETQGEQKNPTWAVTPRKIWKCVNEEAVGKTVKL